MENRCVRHFVMFFKFHEVPKFYDLSCYKVQKNPTSVNMCLHKNAINIL